MLEGGTIKNLSLVNVNIKGNDYVGALVAYNQGTIKNCYIEGDLESDGEIGGVVAFNEGTIINSHTKINVESLSDIGGLVGINTGEILKSSATGYVEGNIYVGGLVGNNKGGKILKSHAIVDIKGDLKIGGLVGTNKGLIEQSYTKGEVRGYERNIGGLVGSNAVENGKILNSYSIANIEGRKSVGGLVGGNGGIIRNSYAAGIVQSSGNVGGLLGYNNENKAKVVNSYWDIDSSKQAKSAAGAGKETEAMQQELTFKAWDFENTWAINEGESYPYLRWEE